MKISKRGYSIQKWHQLEQPNQCHFPVSPPRIAQLERENEQLRAELEVYKNRNTGGRKKHDEAWMTSYRDFAVKYEGGMTIMEIVAQGEISRRTAYRYKAYYDEVQKNNRYKKETSNPFSDKSLPDECMRKSL